MRYIDSIRALPLVLILFGCITFLSPIVIINVNTELIITVSTFLFAILAGFFISRLNNRYDKIRELTSSEDASLLSLYYSSKIYGDKFAGEMRELKRALVLQALLTGPNATSSCAAILPAIF